MGLPKVDINRRTDRVMYVIEEQDDLGVLYIGQTESFNALTTTEVWQIKRMTYDGSTITSLFANDAKYNCRWDQRASYFPAVVPSGIPVPNTTDTVSGTLSPSGLTVGGKVSIVSVSNTTWTPLPATPLLNRNAMSIINRSGQDAVLNYSNIVVGFVGVPLDDGGERQYDITDNIIIYAKMQTSVADLIVEEIA